MSGSIVVPAVQGCPRQLGELLELGTSFPDHRWIFLGTYLGEGPDPESVIHLVRDLGATCFLGAEERELLVRWKRSVTARERRDCLDAVGLSQGSLEWLSTLEAPPDGEGYPTPAQGPLRAHVVPEGWQMLSSPRPGPLRRPPVVSNLEALMDDGLEEI